MIDVLSFLNDRILDRSEARNAFFSITGRSGAPSQATMKVHNDIEAFFAKRPELDEAFAKACFEGMMAISYRSWFWGHFLRRWVLFDLAEIPERPRQIAERYRRRSKDDNHTTPPAHCPVPA